MGIMDGDIFEYRARRREMEDRRMQEITEHNGVQERWWTVSFSAGGISDIPLPWKGTSREDVIASFKAWLGGDDVDRVGGIPWLTIDVTVDGSSSQLTFRPDWVSGFQVGEHGSTRA